MIRLYCGVLECSSSLIGQEVSNAVYLLQVVEELNIYTSHIALGNLSEIGKSMMEINQWPSQPAHSMSTCLAQIGMVDDANKETK